MIKTLNNRTTLMKKKTNRKPKKRSTKTHIKRSRQVQELSFTYGWMVVQWTMHIWYPLFDNEEEPSRNEVPMPKPLPEQKAWNPQPVHSGTSTQTSIENMLQQCTSSGKEIPW